MAKRTLRFAQALFAMALPVALPAASVRSNIPGDFAIGVKTCQFYHDTRLRAVFDNYAHKVSRRVFGSDAPNPEPDFAAQTIVEEDWVTEAYVPPWAYDFKRAGKHVKDVDPSSLPQLKRKLMAILRALHDRYIEEVDWFLIVDDDTFVRVGPLRTYLSKLDPSKPMMVGSRVPSLPHLLPEDIQRLGLSAHCGGGAGFVLSRAALEQLRPKLDECLMSKHTLLHWYWDEVELGRCMWDTLGVECSEPDFGWGTQDFLRPIAEEDSMGGGAITRGRMEAELSVNKRFYGGITSPEDWDRLKAAVAQKARTAGSRSPRDRVVRNLAGGRSDVLQEDPSADSPMEITSVQSKSNDTNLVGGSPWGVVGALTFHKVSPALMEELAGHFTEDVDAHWSQRFLAGDPNA